MDKDDITSVARFNGNKCKWKFAGDGTMEINGDYPRFYLYNMDFNNTEATVYYMKQKKGGKASDGINLGARSDKNGHLKTNNGTCHTYYSRYRHDANVDMAKERHHDFKDYFSIKRNKKYKDIPLNVWIGYKFVCCNISENKVLLESYIDEISGGDVTKMNSGNWKLLLSKVDSYGKMPTRYIKNNPYNTDNKTVFNDTGMSFIRNGFDENAKYKYYQVREIKSTKTNV
jgi:hypothetical protein